MKKYYGIIIPLISLLLYLAIGYLVGINYPESDFYPLWMIFGMYFVIVVSMIIGIFKNRYKKSLLVFLNSFFLIPLSILTISFLLSFNFPDGVIMDITPEGERVLNESYSIATAVGGFGIFSLFFIIPVTLFGLIYLKWFSNNGKNEKHRRL